jgi:hypothetical protein
MEDSKDNLEDSFEGMSLSKKKRELLAARQADNEIVRDEKRVVGRMAMKKVSETVVASAMGEVFEHLLNNSSKK